MAQRWSFEEDIIICKYCIENAGMCLRDFHLEEMADRLKRGGFVPRSKAAIRNRAYVYLNLIDGHQLFCTPRNAKYIYNELYVLSTNTDMVQSIRYYIKEFYNPNECAKKINESNDSLWGLNGDEPKDLTDYVHTIDFNATFPMVLQKYVELKGIKKHNAMCKRIGMKPDTFSAILRGKYKEVKKENVLRLCIGLELRVAEAEELLDSAGYCLSNAVMTDVVIKSFLSNRMYNVVVINAELYENNTPMLFQNYVVEHEEI